MFYVLSAQNWRTSICFIVFSFQHSETHLFPTLQVGVVRFFSEHVLVLVLILIIISIIIIIINIILNIINIIINNIIINIINIILTTTYPVYIRNPYVLVPLQATTGAAR